MDKKTKLGYCKALLDVCQYLLDNDSFKESMKIFSTFSPRLFLEFSQDEEGDLFCELKKIWGEVQERELPFSYIKKLSQDEYRKMLKQIDFKLKL